jgi:hypothetical protein
MKPLLKGLCIGFLLGIPLLAAGIFFYNQIPVISEPEDQERPVEEPVAEAPEPEPEEPDEGWPEPEPEEPDEERPEPEPEEPGSVLLAFAGDVMFSDPFLASYDKSGISAIADSEMLERMQNADLFVINEEFPFSLRGEAMEDKQFTFRADPKYVEIFQKMGVDIATVANNHALDFGRDAFLDTLDTLKSAGITCIGGGYHLSEASAPAVQTIKGQTFAIFGATRVSPSATWYASDSQAGLFQTYDATLLNQKIAEAHTEYDHVIVFVHWGIEKNETPEDYQRSLAKGYIDAGADLVVGCHPHVLQGFEYYNGVPIVYSLGNYLFGNRDGDTVLLEASYDSEGAPSIQLVPCKRVGSVLSRIQHPEALFQHLTELSFGVTVAEDGTLQSQ